MPDTVQTAERPATAAAQTAAAQPTGTAVAKRQPTNFEIELAEYEPQFAAVLPSHIKPDHFRRTIITAINLNPDLIGADRRSLFNACVQAAQDGLYPDGKEAALVIFNTKEKRGGQEIWVKKAQYMPMITGIRKRMRNSGEVDSAVARVIYERDVFSYELGDEERITHQPALGDRGRPVGAYAIIKLKNGEVIREVMSVPEIERVRAVSRAAKTGPWVSWWDEMARKTVLRRAAKAAPTSPELDRLMQRDDSLIADERHEAPSLPPPRPTRATLGAHVTDAETMPGSDQTPHDADTGEFEGDTVRDDVVLETADSMPSNRAHEPQGAEAETGDGGGKVDAFWTAEILAIPVPLKPGTKNAKDWQTWQGEVMARIAEAADTESLAQLQGDNRASIDHLKIAVPPAGATLAQAFVDRAAALQAAAD